MCDIDETESGECGHPISGVWGKSWRSEAMAGLNLLVTGRPGVVKTTLVKKVSDQSHGSLRLAGFTTVEVRDPAGQRMGFDILTTEGQRGKLARVGFRSAVRVGRYGVDLETFESLALPELDRRDVDLLVIDEIGRMECRSDRFCHAVEHALDSQVSVLATIGIANLPFLQTVQKRTDVEFITLMELNREPLVSQLCARLQNLRRLRR